MADQTTKIPKGWKMTTLGEVAEKIVDNRGKTPPITNSGFELLEVNAISENQRAPEYSKVTKFVEEETFNSWFRTGNILEDDILIPTVGTIGNVSFSKLSRGAIAQNLIAFRTDRSKANPLLVYYLLKTPYYKNQLLKLDIGGVQPSIKVPHLLGLEINLPSLPEQRAIAAVLSSLDGKIDLLREQNKTLEATAQAIFKEWFVNFNFPGATGKMNDSELGEIPKGWRVDSIEKYMTLEYGSSLVADKRKGGEVPVFGSSGIVGHHNEALVKGPGVIVGRAGIPGSVYWSQVDFYCMDSTFYVQTEKKYLYYFNYLLRLLKLDRLQSGSAVPGLNRNNVYALSFFVPTDDLLDLFNDLVRNIFEKIYFNDSQIHTLSKLRDTLLPKLMKGEVRVAGFND